MKKEILHIYERAMKLRCRIINPCLAIIMAFFIVPHLAGQLPTETVYWDPQGTHSSDTGGSGAWNSTDAFWWNGTSPEAWVPGVSTAKYVEMIFGAAGQASPYTVTIDFADLRWPNGTSSTVVYATKLRFQGDYIVQSGLAGGTVIGSGDGSAGYYNYLDLVSVPGSTVTFGGNGNPITLNSYGNNSTNPSLNFYGGGTFVIEAAARLSQGQVNGRITIGGTSEAPTAMFMKLGSSATGSRIFVNNGVLNVDGAYITLANSLNTANRSTIQIGATAAASATNRPSVFNLNSGTVIANPTWTAADRNSGVLFGHATTNGYSGGTFNLNGGLLVTTDIMVSATANAAVTALFVFNGGTLSVSGNATQSHLNDFIYGFKTAANNAVIIKEGGAFIDTSNIAASTNGVAVIPSIMGGSGNLTKLGTKTLVLAAANTYTGTTIVNGGTLVAGVSDAFAASAALDIGAGAVFDAGATTQTVRNLSGAGALVVAASGKVVSVNEEDSIFAGKFSGAGAFEKTGSGMLTLDGDNSATETTITFSEGTLLLGANGKLAGAVNVGAGMTFGGQGAAGNASAVTLASGAHLRVGSFRATTSEVLSLGSLSLAAGSVIDFTMASGNINTRIGLASAPVLAGGAQASGITLNFERLASGTYTLGNIAALNGASILINGDAAGPRQTAALRVDGSDLVLDAAFSAAERITWTGGASAAWNRTGTNWKVSGGSTPITFADGDSMTFDSVSDAADKRDITIAGTYMRVADMTVTGNGNYSFSGAALVGEANPDLASTQGRLLMQGTGTLTLANSGVNEFAGGIELQSGAIRAVSAGALASNNINVTDNAALILDAAVLDASGAIAIAAGKTLTLDATATTEATLSGNIAGGNLTKTGDGLVILAAANTHAATTLAGGTLAVAHAGALGSGVITAGASASSVPVLRIDLANHTVNNALDLGANFIAVDTLSNNTTWAGAITGSGTLGKFGSGTLYINGSMLAATAGLHIGEGAIRLVPPAAGSYTLSNELTGSGMLDIRLSGISGTLTLGAGAASGFAGTLGIRDASFTLDSAAAAQLANATLAIGENSFVSKGAGAMSMSGIHFDGGLFKLATTADSVDGVLTVDTLHTGEAGMTITIMIDPSILTVSGTLHNPAPTPGNLFDQDAASGGFKAVDAAHVDGAGSFKLVDLSGNAIVGNLPAVIMQDGAPVADGVYGYIAGVQSDGLHVGIGLQSIEVFSGKQLILNPDQAADKTLSAAISGAGGVIIQTTGTAIIAGANTYTGATLIASGVARAGARDIFRDSASVDIAAGAVFDLGGHVQNIKQLTGSGKVELSNGELILNTASNTALTTALSGVGTLTKNGSGTLTLSSADSRGALSITNVNAGRLVARGKESLGTSGTINVAANAALEFNGIVSGTYSLAILASAATVDVVDSSMVFRNSATRIRNLNLINSTVTAAGSFNAIGSTGVSVNVGPNSTLSITTNPGATLAMNALNVTVERTGRLLFGAFGSINRLNLGATGLLTLKDGSSVGFAGVVSDGIYEVLQAGTTVFESELEAINVYAGPNKGVSLIMTPDGDFAIAKLTTDPRKDILMTFDAMSAAMSTIYSRISESFLLPFSAEAARNAPRDSLWLKGLATFAEYDDTSEQYGHSENTYGFIVGYDRLSRNHRGMVGLYGGFANSKIDSVGTQSKADADQQFLGVYGAAKWGKFYTGADIAAGWSQSNNTRALGFDPGGSATSGASDAMWYGASVEFGYLFTPSKTFTLKPSAGLHYMNVAFDAYREYGASAVQYPDITQDILQSIVALQGSWKFKTPWGWPALFDLSYGWRQNLAQADDEIIIFFVERPDLPQTVRSGGYSRGGQMVGLGLRLAAGRMTTLGITYDYETAAGRNRHTLTGSIRFSW